MENINTVCVSGNLVKNAERPREGILNFTIATNTRQKDGEDWIDYPNYIDCVLYGKRADAIAKYLKKGIKAFVSGKLHQDRWTKDEKTVSRIVIRVDNIEFVGKADDEIPFE